VLGLRKIFLLPCLLCFVGVSGAVETRQAIAGELHEAEAEQEASRLKALGMPALREPWSGDLHGMVERRLVRVLVTPSKTDFFYDGPALKGLTYERLVEFEKKLNASFRTGRIPIKLIYLPVEPHQILPLLKAGYGDLAADSLLVPREAQPGIAYSKPFRRNVTDVLVTGPSAPKIETLDDLSGQVIYVRETSEFHAHLKQLNAQFLDRGMAPIGVIAVEDTLEDEDILEMVHAGVIGMTVARNHVAAFWAGVLPNLKVRKDIKLHEGGKIAWAMRDNSPQLMTLVNRFVNEARVGTLLGNVLVNRYLKSHRYVRNSANPAELKTVGSIATYFKRYAKRYDFDWLLLLAQGYQESGLKQNRRSHRGAVGVMQVLPSTAREKVVRIPDIWNVADNIHAGVKYMAFVRRHYFSDPEIDDFNRMMFSLAAYNAGPNRIARLRREAPKYKLDPNVWFGNVEKLAARAVGRQPVVYVGNVYKYYVGFRLMLEHHKAEEAAQQEAAKRAAFFDTVEREGERLGEAIRQLARLPDDWALGLLPAE